MSKKYSIQRNPFVVPTNDGKLIEEHFGNATDGNSQISIAHMVVPSGWSEPFQTPLFDEYTYIIRGKKQFIIEGEKIILNAGESIKIEKNVGSIAALKCQCDSPGAVLVRQYAKPSPNSTQGQASQEDERSADNA